MYNKSVQDNYFPQSRHTNNTLKYTNIMFDTILYMVFIYKTFQKLAVLQSSGDWLL
jgi:hypothetical protein